MRLIALLCCLIFAANLRAESLMTLTDVMPTELKSFEQPWSPEGDRLWQGFSAHVYAKFQKQHGDPIAGRIAITLASIRLAWVSGYTDNPLREDLQDTKMGDLIKLGLETHDSGVPSSLVVEFINEKADELAAAHQSKSQRR